MNLVTQNYNENVMKLEIKNKMNFDNNNEKIIRHQQIIDNEKNKVKNDDTIISRLK